MTKPNHLFDHLKDPAFQDSKSPLGVSANPERLSINFGESDGDWGTIATLISSRPSAWPVQWFPDSNIAFIAETEIVWDALRLVGLGITGGVAGLTPVVLAEMDEWLKDPRQLKHRARYVKAAIQDGSWLTLVPKPGFPYGLGIRGYMEMMAFRRILAGPLAGGSTFVGTPAADKCKTMNAIKDTMGHRALGLAKKGRIDAEKKGIVNISDELQCLIVIANALLKGQDSVILTADADYIEVFFKAMWLFNTHYHAWLAAKMVKEGSYGDAVNVIANAWGFDGPLAIYRRPTDNLQEALPLVYKSVHVGVLYVTPNGTIQRFYFSFEQQMLDMLKIRGATNGRCTDLFGDANIHIDLSPLGLGLNGPHLGIGRDEGISVQSKGHTMFLSKLDLMHCTHCKERFVR